MQGLAFSIQSFSKLRELNRLYVDKTKYAYNLITQEESFFLSRPRRFGKSLFISMVKEILLGKKELFKDLWIESSDYTWPVYGVIHLDFSCLKNNSAVSLEETLCLHLSEIARAYNLSINLSSNNANGNLILLVNRLHEKYGKVAVLIDEYDHPLLSALQEPHCKEILNVIQSFFTTIKGLDAQLRFIFLTGVSAFSKAGIFSGLNNLKNLTYMPEFSGVCGYSQEEVDRYFIPYLEELAKDKKLSLAEVKAEMKRLYNGYHFSPNAPTVYNPFSCTNALYDKNLKNFWFESGTPTFLIKILQTGYAKKNSSIFQMEEFKVSEAQLESFTIDAIPLPVLMLQTGYLTIKGCVKNRYKLGFPNLEVQASLQKYILGVFLHLESFEAITFSTNLMDALEEENIEAIASLLNTICSCIPSNLHISEEKFYHAVILTAFQASGVSAIAEHKTADGVWK
jgi:hypothetical protein